MGILKFTSQGRSAKLDNAPEELIENFSIKGDTVVNYFGTNLLSNYSFNSQNGAWTRNGHRITYRNSKSLNGAWWEDVYMLNNSFRDLILKPNTTYTITYKLHEFKRYGRDPEFFFRIGNNHIYTFSKTKPGIYSFTFTTDASCLNTIAGFRGTRGNAENTTEERVLDIEFISFVEGAESTITSPTKGVQSVGINNKGIEVACQTQSPILGEYILQGDIPAYIKKIEDKIIENEDRFEISWI